MAIRKAFLTQKNVDAIATVLRQQRQHKIVVDRLASNVAVPGTPVGISKEKLWHAHMLGLLTSQQPSSEGDPVFTLLKADPFPLSYQNCRLAKNPQEFIREVLTNHGGIRFCEERIPSMAAKNLYKFEADEWEEVKRYANHLKKHRARPHDWQNYQLDHSMEEKAADYMDDFEGFGKKQSRNFWQALGLTRYVSVLDSRVKKWCVQNLEGGWAEFELSKKRDYMDMSHTILELCRQAQVLPCMFDAAVFSIFERETSSASWCRW
jgi:hypothetical protein